MSTWYVDKGLSTLIAQVKAKYPGMTVGTIAGGGHVATWPATDHAPEPDGSVDAADFMIGSVFKASDAQWLWDKLRQYRDKRIAYVIYNHHIVSSTVSPWVVRDYHGNDPHTNHVHVSVNDKHESDASKWSGIDVAELKFLKLDGNSLPELRQGMDDDDYDGWNNVARVQRIVGAEADGNYGPGTAAAVKKFIGSGDGKKIGLAEWLKLYGISMKDGV